MLIVGLGHRRGVGKNTVAEYLKAGLEHDGYSVELRSFAAQLKEIAHKLFSWGGLEDGPFYEQHYNLKEVVLPKLSKSPRTIWIELGNKIRDIHPEIWVNAALVSSTSDVVIFTDARYPNELDEIHNRGGMVFKVYRPDAPIHGDVADCAAKDYVMWDGMINNGGSLGELMVELGAFIPLIEKAADAKTIQPAC